MTSAATARCTAFLLKRTLIIAQTFFAATVVTQNGFCRLWAGARMDDVDVT